MGDTFTFLPSVARFKGTHKPGPRKTAGRSRFRSHPAAKDFSTRVNVPVSPENSCRATALAPAVERYHAAISSIPRARCHSCGVDCYTIWIARHSHDLDNVRGIVRVLQWLHQMDSVAVDRLDLVQLALARPAVVAGRIRAVVRVVGTNDRTPLHL